MTGPLPSKGCTLEPEVAGPDVQPAAVAGCHPAGLAAGSQASAASFPWPQILTVLVPHTGSKGLFGARIAFSRALSKWAGHRPGLETSPGWGAVTVWGDWPMAEVSGGCGSYTFPRAHPVPSGHETLSNRQHPVGALASSPEKCPKKPSGWHVLEERPGARPAAARLSPGSENLPATSVRQRAVIKSSQNPGQACAPDDQGGLQPLCGDLGYDNTCELK